MFRELEKDLVPTGDGSYTMAPGGGEKMHSQFGAFFETAQIYGNAVLEALDRGWPLRVLSVGLGMGYVEILTVAIALKNGKTVSFLESRETDSRLVELFLGWVSGVQFPGLLGNAYLTIEKCLLEQVGVPAESVRQTLREMKKNGQWVLREGLDENLSQPPIKNFTLVLYDPFSRKTSPHLWEEIFLQRVLSFAAEQCIFSTYASRGSLKKALISHKFEIRKTPGVGAKRESTFAVRTSPSY